MSEDVTAVVVSYNSASVLPACLTSLRHQVARIVVVDNASSDDSIAMAQAHGAEVLVNANNQGFGRAANRGLAVAKTPYALLVNPDATLTEGAVQLLLQAAETYPEAGLLAPRLVEPDGRHFWSHASLLAKPPLHNPSRSKRLPEGDCCAPFLSGAVLFIRQKAWRAVGGFDPSIFLFYEDDDVCRRMMDEGWSLVHVHQALAFHGRGQSSGKPTPAIIAKVRWHMAWSRGYVASRYGLSSPCWGTVATNLPKWLLAHLLRHHLQAARYRGSVLGAVSFLRGVTALDKEGLKLDETA